MFDVDLVSGVCLCGYEVGQAPGERGVAPVNNAPAFAYDEVEFVSIDGARAHSFGFADVWARGRDVGWVARSRVDQHESASE